MGFGIRAFAAGTRAGWAADGEERGGGSGDGWMIWKSSILANLPVYQPGQPIAEVARELGLPADSIIKLASNENPLGPSRMALKAMRETLPKLNLYPDGNAFYLKQKLAA